MRAVKNPYASDCASELMAAVDMLKGAMQSDSAIVGGAGLALALIGGGFFIGYRLYASYQAKQHEAEIKQVNELHSRYLTNIIVPENGAKLELPAIFQRRSNPEAGWDSMHLNDQEVEALAKNSAKIPDDKELNIYRDNITRAINDLKAYYFFHDEEERSNLTCLVLTYLMHIVDKLLRFEGYVYDIAYLNAIMQFVHFYAKSKGEHSRHYKKLSLVYDYLKMAREELETHYATRSQSMILKELRGDCSQASSDGITKLARFVTDDETALKFANIDRLAKNILHPASVVRMFPGKVLSLSECATGMCWSRVTNWVTILADYWQKARNPATMVKDILPLSAFALPDRVTEQETKLLLLLFFSESCFNDKRLFQSAKKELLVGLSHYSKLLQLEISLICQCNEIEGIIQNRGVMEVNNPVHCQEQYTRLSELRDQVTIYVNLVKHQFAVLNTFNKKPMRPQEQFLNELIDSLDVIQKDVHLNVEAMFECRKKFKECQAKWALESQEASLVGRALAEACQLPSSYPSVSTPIVPKLPISGRVDMPASSEKSTRESSLWYASSRPVVSEPALQGNRLMPPPPRSPSHRALSSPRPCGDTIHPPLHRVPSSLLAFESRSHESLLEAPKAKLSEFMMLFESTVRAHASYPVAIQLIFALRDVLADYLGGVGVSHHFLRLTRHHLDAVKVRVDAITLSLKTLRDPLLARQLLETQLHELLLERAIKGTLKERIDFIVEKCRAAGYHASNAAIVQSPAAAIM